MAISSPLLGNSNNTGHQTGVSFYSQNNPFLFNHLANNERRGNIFPIDVLPPVLRDVVVEIGMQTQTMNPLVFTSVLGVLSLASQGCADIEWVKGQLSPLSLFMISIAESGTRKTTVDSIVLKIINKLEAKEQEKHNIELEVFELAKKIWDIERKQIELFAKKNAIKGLDNKDNFALLVNHNRSMPQEPKRPRFIYSNSTMEAFIAGLANNWPSAGLFSDEGSNVINSRILNQVGALNDLWSGSDVVVDRRGEGSIRLHDARCTISLMLQPNEFYKLIQKKGDDLKGNGFLARCLICHPPSTHGLRFTDNSKLDLFNLENFNSRVVKIISLAINSNNKRFLLKLDSVAESMLIGEINKIEGSMCYGGYLFDHKEYASKIADNMVRLAGIFHLFEGYDQRVEVSQLNMQRAISVIYYYVNEYLYIFPSARQTVDADARKLMASICQIVLKNNNYNIERSYISKYAPYALRDKLRLSNALMLLYSWGWIYFYKIKSKAMIQVNQIAYSNLVNVPKIIF